MALQAELWMIVAAWRGVNIDWSPSLDVEETSDCARCSSSEFASALGEVNDVPHELRHDLIERIERYIGIDDRAWWRSDDTAARTDALVFEMQCAIRLIVPELLAILEEWIDPLIAEDVDELVSEIEWSLALRSPDEAESGERD